MKNTLIFLAAIIIGNSVYAQEWDTIVKQVPIVKPTPQLTVILDSVLREQNKCRHFSLDRVFFVSSYYDDLDIGSYDGKIITISLAIAYFQYKHHDFFVFEDLKKPKILDYFFSYTNELKDCTYRVYKKGLSPDEEPSILWTYKYIDGKLTFSSMWDFECR